MEPSFGYEDVRLGEALYRSEAHCLACYELYRVGRKPDALLQAARPITDVLPWLETEVRANRAELAGFVRAVSAVGAQVRANVRPRKLRRVLSRVEPATTALLEEAIGPISETRTYLATVSVNLLETALQSYRRAVTDENLGEYQTAYACARRGTSLFERAVGRRSSPAERDLAILRAVLPAVEPPARLARIEMVQSSVERILAAAVQFGASSAAEPALDDALSKIARVLDDVLSSYAEGVPALSARLAASLHLRAYEPIRPRLVEADHRAEERLTALIGVELRRGINDGAPVERINEIGAEVHGILDSLGVSDYGDRGNRVS
jgi:hypothetical protein